MSHRIDWDISSKFIMDRLHVEVKGAILRQSVSQVHEIVVQSLLQLQHFNLTYTWTVQLVAYLHSYSE